MPVSRSLIKALTEGQWAMALQWDCVNLDEGVLIVRKTLEEVVGHFGVKEPKSATGRRAVTLAIEVLKPATQEGETGRVWTEFGSGRIPEYRRQVASDIKL